MKRADPEQPLAHRLRQVLQAGARGRDLVRQIMNIYQPQEMTREPLFLSEAIQDVLGLIAASVPKYISREFDLPLPGPVVLASPSELQQVITNLCVNALHAMGQEKGRLAVRLDETQQPPPCIGERHEPAPHGWARVQIEDTGCGMDQTTLSNAFDPFFTTKGQGKGTGLGPGHGATGGHQPGRRGAFAEPGGTRHRGQRVFAHQPP